MSKIITYKMFSKDLEELLSNIPEDTLGFSYEPRGEVFCITITQLVRI